MTRMLLERTINSLRTLSTIHLLIVFTNILVYLSMYDSISTCNSNSNQISEKIEYISQKMDNVLQNQYENSKNFALDQEKMENTAKYIGYILMNNETVRTMVIVMIMIMIRRDMGKAKDVSK